MTVAGAPAALAPGDDGLSRCDDDARWDAFVASSPHGSAFARSWFLRALGTADPALAIDRWMLGGDGHDARAAALILRRGDAVCEAPYPFSPYQSLMLSEAVATAPPHRSGKEIVDVTEALAAALARRYRRLSLCLHPAFADVRGLQWFHYGQPDTFRVDVRYTGLVDLGPFAAADFDAYLATVRSGRRYEHRRAAAKGIVAEVSRDIGALDALHAATFARQEIVRPAHEAALLRAITAAALEAGTGELLLCRAPSGEPASATLFVFDERCGYYLFGANAPEFRALNTGTFLVIEAIRRCRERGLARVDLCGVNSPQRGDFKTSLGAAVAPYFLAAWQAPA